MIFFVYDRCYQLILDIIIVIHPLYYVISIQIYFYAESKTTHTTHADGLEIFNFPK